MNTLKKIMNDPIFWLTTIMSSVVVIALIVIGIVYANSKPTDQVTCDKTCEYNKAIEEQKRIGEILLQTNDVKKDAFENYKEALVLYNKALKEKSDADAKVNSFYLTDDYSVKMVEYEANFLRYLDYEVPEYDSNNTGFVQFLPWTSEAKTKIMNIAYQLGGKDFVLTLHAENSYRDHKKQSDCHGSKCENASSGLKREESYGYCQLNRGSYSDFLDSVYFTDPEAQLIKCRNEYKKALDNGNITTKFYGYNNRELYSKYFSFLE